MTNPGQVRQRLAELIAAASGGDVAIADVLAGEQTLSALGLASLARLRLIDAIEDSFDVDLDLEADLSSFEHVDTLAAYLAGLLAERFEPLLQPDAILQAVPLHRRRRRQRGFNQAQLLADELRRAWPVGRARGHLIRRRDTRSQVGLDRAQRRRNVEDAFWWEGPNLSGRPVLLVDDVITTCATVEACARALREAGAGEVRALSVARVNA